MSAVDVTVHVRVLCCRCHSVTCCVCVWHRRLHDLPMFLLAVIIQNSSPAVLIVVKVLRMLRFMLGDPGSSLTHELYSRKNYHSFI